MLQRICSNPKPVCTRVIESLPAANGALLDKTHMIKDEKRCAPARRFSQIFGYVFDFAHSCQSRAVLLTPHSGH